jgi:hypothetical protein
VALENSHLVLLQAKIEASFKNSLTRKLIGRLFDGINIVHVGLIYPPEHLVWIMQRKSTKQMGKLILQGTVTSNSLRM